MSVQLLKDKEENFRIIMQGEPSYVKALQQSPIELEQEAKEGIWLILLVAVWSAVDLNAVDTAVSAIRPVSNKVTLGIRPFDAHEEIRRWCPTLKDAYGSPIWLLFKNGVKVAEAVGLQTEEQVRRIIESTLSSLID
jgi:hypothetical protein